MLFGLTVFERRAAIAGRGGCVALKILKRTIPGKTGVIVRQYNTAAALLIVVLCHRGLFCSHPPHLSGSNPEWDWSQFLWEHDILQNIYKLHLCI